MLSIAPFEKLLRPRTVSSVTTHDRKKEREKERKVAARRSGKRIKSVYVYRVQLLAAALHFRLRDTHRLFRFFFHWCSSLRAQIYRRDLSSSPVGGQANCCEGTGHRFRPQRDSTRLRSTTRLVRTRSPSRARSTPTSTASSSTTTSLPQLVSSRPSRPGAPIHRPQHTKHTREIVKHGRHRRAAVSRVRRQGRHTHARTLRIRDRSFQNHDPVVLLSVFFPYISGERLVAPTEWKYSYEIYQTKFTNNSIARVERTLIDERITI